MDAVDLERIGVEHHQAEVGLAAADDERLQAEGRVADDRIELDDELISARRPLGVRKLTERLAIERVIKMAAMPATASRHEAERDRFGQMCGRDVAWRLLEEDGQVVRHAILS